MADGTLHCVIGAAGHIDHGKTTLIHALTGTDCDRLAEEKRRGITIDIGFARLELGDGKSIGVVDVPGHQRFVHNMLAGAAGIDIAMLVVAATEAVMPQTVEHLAILDILGIKSGVVALTKRDLVDNEMLALAVEEVTELIANSCLAGAKIIPCSALTGEGVGEIKAELERLANIVPQKPADLHFKMPIDRAFNIKGHGLVVTGTVFTGRTKIDDRLVIVPGNMETRVRRIQNHGQTADMAEAGTRSALNIAGVEKAEIKRGMVICDPAIAREYTQFTGYVTCHRLSTLSIAHGRACLLHMGTAEVMCRVYLEQDKNLVPGSGCVAQIRFDEPLQLNHGDRFVLRSSSARHTLGGGTALEPGGAPLGRRAIKSMSAKWEALRETGNGIDAFIRETRWGRAFDDVRAVFNLPPALFQKLKSKNISTFEWKGAKYVFDSGDAETNIRDIVKAVTVFHENNPSALGVEESQLTITLAGNDPSSTLLPYWIRRAVSSGKIETNGALFRIPGREAVFTGADEAVRNKILDAFLKGGLAPPKTDHVHEMFGMNKSETSKLIRLLIKTGDLISLAPDFTLHKVTLANARAKLITAMETEGSVDTARYRDILGVGRKAAIDILEYFDTIGLTKRVDNKGTRMLK